MDSAFGRSKLRRSVSLNMLNMLVESRCQRRIRNVEQKCDGHIGVRYVRSLASTTPCLAALEAMVKEGVQ